MFTLAKAPQGLLQLFRLRTGGRMPDAFEQAVRAVIETRDFYGSDIYIPIGTTTTTGALAGLSNTLTVTGGPLGLRSLGAHVNIGAAAATNVFLSWFMVLPSFPTLAIPIGSQNVGALAAGGSAICGTAPLPYVVPAGTQLTAQAQGVAAGVDHTISVRGLLENFVSV